MPDRKRIAVIGAGPSGLSVLYALREHHGKEVEVVCFERNDGIGGLWYYTDETGIDKYGLPVHTSMYRNLWINGPKEALEFYHHPFPDDTPSFFPREVMYEYIQGYAKKFELTKFIKFETYVEGVNYDDESQTFYVTYKYLPGQESNTDAFDYVVVCCGHFSTPYVPDFPGIKSFSGLVLHAHDFRDAKKYAGKRVLCICGSYSAEDLALQCHKYGAKHVTISYRTKAMGFKWPKNVEERPLLIKVCGSKVEFSDGSDGEYDVIMICTGYLHSFPFMDEKLRLNTYNRLAPPLYKQVVFPDNPRVFYIGMQDQYYTFTMFFLQALYTRDVLLGKSKVPDKTGMLEEIKQQQDREAKLNSQEDDIWFQTDYVEDLAALTKSQSVNAGKCFCEWEHHKAENILTYRDKQHPSIYTGKVAPKGQEWLKAL